MKSRGILVSTLVVLSLLRFLPAQNIEGGFHAGYARIGSEGPVNSPNTDHGSEYGAWAILWPTERWAIVGDWSYIKRDDFLLSRFPLGEFDRNRQYVDLTLQYHFGPIDRFHPFVEIGGGFHYNNREVINRQGLPFFEEDGHESTRRGVWTLGAGLRSQLVPHLHWIGEVKVHNLGRDERDGFRAFTGLSVSFR